MKKLILSIPILILLKSCIVSTATKVVTTAGKVAVGAVKTTVKGINWTIKKANGKINEDRLNGKWKIVGYYKGSFEEFSTQSNPVNYFNCNTGEEIYEFKMSREKFYHYPCGNSEPIKYKLEYSFEKNPESGNKENMITYGPSYFTVIDVTNDNLALEGYFVEEGGRKVKSICLLEKDK